MKKILLLFAILQTVFASCGDDPVDPNNSGENNQAYTGNNETVQVVKYNDADSVFVGGGLLYEITSETDKTAEVLRISADLETFTNDGEITVPAYIECDGEKYTVTSLGAGAFSFCWKITGVSLPSTLLSIEVVAFRNCKSLKTVMIPNSVQSIEVSAFSNCSSLESFTGKFASADQRCLVLDGVLTAFAPSGLTSYEIPSSVKAIGSYAFWGCTKTWVQLPDSLTSEGTNAFEAIPGLTTMVIPSSVKMIGDCAFYDCDEMIEITSLNTTPPSVGDDSFPEALTSTCTLKVPAASVQAYKAAEGWKEFQNIVGLADTRESW